MDVRAAGQEAKRVTKETYGCGERGYEDKGVRVGDDREGEGWELKGGARRSRNHSSLVLHAEVIRLISLKICTLRSVLLRLLKLPGSGFIGENSGECGELMKTVCLDRISITCHIGEVHSWSRTSLSLNMPKKLPSNEPSSDKYPHNRRT